MNKLRAFSYIYTKSIISAQYYKEVLKTTVKFSLKYFVLLGVFAALITTVSSSITAVPKVKDGMENLSSSAKQLYPQDLVVSSKDNVWTVNKPEPYFIPFPATEEGQPESPRNMIVLYHEGTVDDIDKLDTLILVNAKNILVKESNGFRAYPLQNVPDGTFDKVAFEKLVEEVKQDTKILPYLIVPFIFLGLLIYFIGIRLIYLLIMALPIMLIAKILKVEMDYKGAFKFGIHVITVAIALEVLANILRFDVPVPMWFTLVLLVQTVVVLVQIRKTDITTPANKADSK